MSQEIKIEAQRLNRQRKRKSVAFVFDAMAFVVDLLPSYRNTARGRKFATQAKIATIGAGLIIVVFAGHPWLFIGVALMAAALIAPIREMKKRTLLSKLKKSRYTWTEKRLPVVVSYDGNRMVTREGTRSIHKFKPASVDVRELDGKEAFVIRGGSSRKSDCIVFKTAERAENLEPIERDAVELVVEAGRASLDPLLDRMEQP